MLTHFGLFTFHFNKFKSELRSRNEIYRGHLSLTYHHHPASDTEKKMRVDRAGCMRTRRSPPKDVALCLPRLLCECRLATGSRLRFLPLEITIRSACDHSSCVISTADDGDHDRSIHALVCCCWHVILLLSNCYVT